MGLKQIQNPQEPVSLIADLDALISEKIGFKLNGQIHVLQPITAEQMMEMELARVKLLAMLNARGDGLALDGNEIYERYFEVIHPIVPTLEFAELLTLKVVQLNNLLTLVFRTLAGDPTLYDDSQKKNPLSQKMTGL